MHAAVMCPLGARRATGHLAVSGPAPKSSSGVGEGRRGVGRCGSIRVILRPTESSPPDDDPADTPCQTQRGGSAWPVVVRPNDGPVDSEAETVHHLTPEELSIEETAPKTDPSTTLPTVLGMPLIVAEPPKNVPPEGLGGNRSPRGGVSPKASPP